MHLNRVRVRNFRNLADVDVPLRAGTVIVGENRVGKSNLVHALRLVLDSTLPNSDRQLRREDFSDALSDGTEDWDPFASREEIEISVEFGDIGAEAEALAALGQALIEGTPMRARLTYRFAPRDTDVPEGETPRYEWHITGGVVDEEIRGDLRRYLRLQYLSALRDVEADIGYWRRSPLRPLLEAAAAELDRDALGQVADAVKAANEQVLELKPISDLSSEITERTTELVGEDNTAETSLGVASSDPQRILRGLRLFTDAASRPLRSASLGTLNVLYLALLQLSLEREVSTHDVAHVVLAIEEPEAHLHPHVQRLIFRDALRSPDEHERTVLVTSHSPHVVSVTPPRNLVVLRGDAGGTSVGVASDADLEPGEWDDIERYLDATRGELVFARRVLLVEGFAETVMIPKLASDMGLNLDKAGITVCAIHGTHFGSYAKYLTALGTAWAVITDGDPRDQGRPRGEVRAERLLATLNRSGVEADEAGIFVGDVTFEPDLLAASSSNRTVCVRVLATGEWSPPTGNLLQGWQEGDDIAEDAYSKVVTRFGKARFAQRLAAQDDTLTPPSYIKRALDYLSA